MVTLRLTEEELTAAWALISSTAILGLVSVGKTTINEMSPHVDILGRLPEGTTDTLVDKLLIAMRGVVKNAR